MGIGRSKDFSDDVIIQGILIHKELGSLFCTLTQHYFYIFPNKRTAFKDKSAYKARLPTFDLVASVSGKGNFLLIRTCDRLMCFRAKSSSNQLKWVQAFGQLLRNRDLALQRQDVWSSSDKLTLHVHLIEATQLIDPAIAYSCKVHLEKSEDIPVPGAKYLSSYEKEKIVVCSPSVDCIDGDVVWATPLTFTAADRGDTLVVSIVKAGKKEIGSVKVPIHSMDLGDENLIEVGSGEFGTMELGDSMVSNRGTDLDATLTRNSSSDEEEGSLSHQDHKNFERMLRPKLGKIGRQKNVKEMKVQEEESLSLSDDLPFAQSMNRTEKALGMHKWLDIRDSKGQFKGKLHLAVRVESAHTLDDLTTSSTDFCKRRSELLCSSQVWEDDLLFSKRLGVYTGTWNVGNASPADNLHEWLPKGKLDIMAFGVQECKYEARERFSSCREDWIESLRQVIPQGFELLEYVSLWEIRLAVFVDSNLRSEITDVHCATEATGIAGVLGNKGGTVVSFMCRNTSICFVNSHLAAHQHKTKKRNENVYEIVNAIKEGCARGADLVNGFDVLFWMGDLNYRLDWADQGDEKVPSEEQFMEMTKMVSENRFDELFQVDQLLKERLAHRVFTDFNEGVYAFEPTFKVRRNQRLEYNPQRSPAWCDRVLWKSVGTSHIRQKRLRNVLQLKSSDHKPVYSVFSVESFFFRAAQDLRWNSAVAQVSSIDIEALEEPIPKNVKVRAHCPAFHGRTIEFTKEEVDSNKFTDIPLVYSALPRLMRFFVVFQLLSAEKIIGTAQVSLSSIVFQPTDYYQPMPFVVFMTLGTRGTARLRGSINLKWIKERRGKAITQQFQY